VARAGADLHVAVGDVKERYGNSGSGSDVWSTVVIGYTTQAHDPPHRPQKRRTLLPTAAVSRRPRVVAGHLEVLLTGSPAGTERGEIRQKTWPKAPSSVAVTPCHEF